MRSFGPSCLASRSIVEKWAPAHKVSLDDAKETLQTRADIGRYGEPDDIAASWVLVDQRATPN
jgi:hypothetical protein